MNFELPKTIEIAGSAYAIRWDYRDILTILAALGDPDLTPEEKSIATLWILYPDAEELPGRDVQEALEKASWFIDGGSAPNMKNGPRLMDWEQDFQWIVAPVNRVLGRDVREDAPLHWWSFLSAYYEIGDCTFAQIVRIRDMQARGKPMDKADKEWARRNADLIHLKNRYSEADDELLAAWTKGGVSNAE